jgi:hypothetical protein
MKRKSSRRMQYYYFNIRKQNKTHSSIQELWKWCKNVIKVNAAKVYTIRDREEE